MTRLIIIALMLLATPAQAAQTVRGVRTRVTMATAHAELRAALEAAISDTAPPIAVQILTAHFAHETGGGRRSYNYNFAGIKGIGPTGKTTHLRTSEGWGVHKRATRDGFRAYDSVTDGARDYVRLLLISYPGAISSALAGDSLGFVRSLYRARYFTANPKTYHRAIARWITKQQEAEKP